MLGKPLGEPALSWNLIEIRDVPELACLFRQRGDEMRMAVAKRIDGYAACEVQISVAVLLDQPDTLTPFEGQGGTREGLVKRRTAHHQSPGEDPGLSTHTDGLRRDRKIKKPPERRPRHIFQVFPDSCQCEGEKLLFHVLQQGASK